MFNKVPAFMISYTEDRTLEEKLSDFTSAKDYGATSEASVGSNTTAISNALAAVSGSQCFVVVPADISYNGDTLVIPDDGVMISPSAYSGIKFTFATDGDTASHEVAGISMSQKGHSGVILRPVDYGLAGYPMLSVGVSGGGSIPAGTESRFFQLSNYFNSDLPAPPTPSARKAVLYLVSEGTDTLYVKFASGLAVPLAAEGTLAHLSATATWDPGSISHGSSVSTSVTVSGAALGDIALASFSLDIQELTISAHVGATNTVHVVLHNATGGAIDLASGTLKVMVLKNFGL